MRFFSIFVWLSFPYPLKAIKCSRSKQSSFLEYKVTIQCHFKTITISVKEQNMRFESVYADFIDKYPLHEQNFVCKQYIYQYLFLRN